MQLQQPRSFPGTGEGRKSVTPWQQGQRCGLAEPSPWRSRGGCGSEGRVLLLSTAGSDTQQGPAAPVLHCTANPRRERTQRIPQGWQRVPTTQGPRGTPVSGAALGSHGMSGKEHPHPLNAHQLHPVHPPQPGRAGWPIWNRAPRPAPGTASAAAGNVKNPKRTKRGFRGCPEEFPGLGFSAGRKPQSPKLKPQSPKLKAQSPKPKAQSPNPKAPRHS